MKLKLIYKIFEIYNVFYRYRKLGGGVIKNISVENIL